MRKLGLNENEDQVRDHALRRMHGNDRDNRLPQDSGQRWGVLMYVLFGGVVLFGWVLVLLSKIPALSFTRPNVTTVHSRSTKLGESREQVGQS